MTNEELFTFIDNAGKATWAGSAEPLVRPERKGFHELTYVEGDFLYKDSFIGNHRSWGTELVWYQQIPVWNCLYGGGMSEGYEHLSDDTYAFLKKALNHDEDGYLSFRGPHSFSDGEWTYTYEQTGDVDDFHGYEQIFYKGELVHYYRTIGGVIK